MRSLIRLMLGVEPVGLPSNKKWAAKLALFFQRTFLETSYLQEMAQGTLEQS